MNLLQSGLCPVKTVIKIKTIVGWHRDIIHSYYSLLFVLERIFMIKEYFELEKYEALKESDNLIFKALELVTTLFENDLDKGGLPYMLHLLYVYKHVYSEEEKVIALLHDIIEDKQISKEDLIEFGFPIKIVEDVSILSRKKHTDYGLYIDNLVKKGSIEALHVKLSDLRNNMDMSRIKNPTVKDYERVKNRYTPSYEKILNRLKEMEK